MTRTQAARPGPLPIHLESIPAELREKDQWVAWRYARRKGRWEKLPIDPKTGKHASVSDPTTWASCEEAARFYSRGKADGIGFVLTEGYVVFDLDNCRDPQSGAILSWATSIVEDVRSYTEVSPSGTGLRIVVRGTLPGGRGRKKGGVEMYAQDKYLTFTGMHLGGTPTAVEDGQEVVLRLYRRLFGVEGEQGGVPEVAPEAGLTDDEVIEKATRANGEKFARLMRGDASGYASPSEADLALLAILAYWTGRDPVRMERLFERSALARREKWQRDDYRQATIGKALRPRFNQGNQANQAIQEDTGIDTTHGLNVRAIPKGRETTGSVGRIVPQQGEGMGVSEALDLADAHEKLPCGIAAFHLARRLRKLSEKNPEQFEEAVRAFCKLTKHDADEVWYAFLACWDKVKLNEGDDILAWAFQAAKDRPYATSPCPGVKYAQVASIAHHLAERTRPKPFLLPCVRLASLLGTSAMTISNIIALLKKNGVIKCVDENYQFTKGKAKEYLLAGE